MTADRYRPVTDASESVIGFRLTKIENALADLTGQIARYVELAARQQSLHENLERLEEQASEGLTRVEAQIERLNSVLIGDGERPGIAGYIAAHEVAINTHSRNFRIIVGTFVAQILLTLGWALDKIYQVVK